MIGRVAPVAMRLPDVGGLRYSLAPPPARTVPTCHPDDEHFSQGLCRSCFWRQYRRAKVGDGG